MSTRPGSSSYIACITPDGRDFGADPVRRAPSGAHRLWTTLSEPRAGRNVARIILLNKTHLDDARLLALCAAGAADWAVGTVNLLVRYSRGADFSGTCFYLDRRIHVNLGRHLDYPYAMSTNLAKARTIGRRWFRPIYRIEMASAYQVVLFIFMHELYHLLVKKAQRNTRQKEAMCDRFAARFLMDRFGAGVVAPDGRSVPREVWDFQDLERFVASARDCRVTERSARRVKPAGKDRKQEQLLLFPR